MEQITLFASILILASVVVYLLFFYDKKKSVVSEFSKVTAKEFFDFSKKSGGGNKVDVYLTVNHKEYRFSHDRKYEREIQNIGKILGQSFELIKESKYRDIAHSRKRDVLSQLKRLTTISTLSNQQYIEISNVINNFVESVHG